MPLDIRLLKDSEYKAANDFYNSTSHINRPAPPIPRSYPEFCWEFMNCPNGKATFSGAWEIEEGKQPVLVGIQCVIILKMIIGNGKQILAAKGEATLIDIKALIKYKKTDILKELLVILIEDCQKKGIEFLWGFNNIPASYKRLGFETPFKSYHGVLVLQPFKAYKNIISLKSKHTRMGYFKIAFQLGLSYFFSLKKIIVPVQKKNYHINFELNENELLFKNASPSEQLMFLVQDKEYLKWRISENPYPINYKSYQLLDGDKLVAQVICSIQKDVCFIEQTLFDKKLTSQNIHFLLKNMLLSLKNENICLVRYTGFKQNHLNLREMDLLKRMGFIFTGKGEWFTFKNLSDNSLINPENIYLSRMYKQGIN